MKKTLSLSLLVLPLLFLGGCSLINQNETAVNTGEIENIPELQEQFSGLVEQFSGLQAKNKELKEGIDKTTGSNKTTTDRYRKIYSSNYSVYKKDVSTYKICLASNKEVCINLIQYNGKIIDYYKASMTKEDRENLSPSREPTVTTTIKGRIEWRCSIGAQNSILCFNENSNGSLIMRIDDQKGEGFHSGEYDKNEIFKVIDIK